jgi:hypothetical protein
MIPEHLLARLKAAADEWQAGPYYSDADDERELAGGMYAAIQALLEHVAPAEFREAA